MTSMNSAIMIAPPDALGRQQEREDRYAEPYMSKGTRRAYSSAWRRFTEWAEGKGKGCWPPTSPRLLLQYLLYLKDEGSGESGLEQVIAAVVMTHRIMRIKKELWPTEDIGFREAKKNILHEIAHVKAKKTEMAPELLKKIVLAAPHDALGYLDIALVLTGFTSALRSSELAGLDVRDVVFGKRGAILTVRQHEVMRGRENGKKGGATIELGGKTIKPGETWVVSLPKAKDPILCATTALAYWLWRAPAAPDQPLFRVVELDGTITGRRIRTETIRERIHAMVERTGEDARPYAAHSLRSGWITAAARKGKRLDQIMERTGHKDVKTVLEYIRKAKMFSGEDGGRGIL